MRPVAELQRISGIVVAFSKSGWMNEHHTIDWVERTWATFNFACCLLLWDAYKCHHIATVKNTVDRQTSTDLMVIPR